MVQQQETPRDQGPCAQETERDQGPCAQETQRDEGPCASEFSIPDIFTCSVLHVADKAPPDLDDHVEAESGLQWRKPRLPVVTEKTTKPQKMGRNECYVIHVSRSVTCNLISVTCSLLSECRQKRQTHINSIARSAFVTKRVILWAGLLGALICSASGA